ncbi:T9SS type A sorting domain-containing protein [Taibaiella koreensis]|uniref:T9SS type A sorting domain-containing protein n=1 Tax=Taibaiella koreensis TaxID=1268548 RepID=UPI000E59B333|nr:T9SS type A sorting domain-containing protein [Taibaiella koreensis]
MKSILTVLICCLFFCSSGRNRTFDKLNEVNACWAKQPEAATMPLPAYRELSEGEWIRRHLSLVEQVLRARSVSALSAGQRAQRLRALDHLHAYWQEGRFPVNMHYAYRTPIFIDQDDNFCAVGYLLKASGSEAVSRKIAGHTNLAYVAQMHYPQLDSWAHAHGFTKEELAWIQPTYPPRNQVVTLGNGVSGTVKELCVDPGGDKLYVGGAFDQVDGNIGSRNIAYVTQADPDHYTWHDMAGGVNGEVHAITAHEGKIFAGGRFTMAGTVMARNVACWENGSWQLAGCLDGTVEDLAVYNGRLYAAGTFNLCAASDEVNLAWWNGMGWVAVPGLSGTVKTMETAGGRLILGGSFQHLGAAANAIAWDQNNGFQPFDHPVDNTILDFELFKGVLYAVCEQVTTGNTRLLLRLEGNEWRSQYDPIGFPFQPVDGQLSMRTLLADGDYLLAGGLFTGNELVGTLVRNNADVSPAPGEQSKRFFWLDDAVNKMIWFKGEMIVGGAFRNGFTGPVGSIGRRALLGTGISPSPEFHTFSVTPNPVTGSAVILRNGWGASGYSLLDMNGRVLAAGTLKEDRDEQQIRLPATCVPGLYLMQLNNEKGIRANQKLLVR